MKFMHIFAVFAAATMAQAVTLEECKENYLPSVLDCYEQLATGVRPACDPLPFLGSAVPQNQTNEMGYWIQTLRDTPTSRVFAVSDNTYSSLIVVDMPPTQAVGDRRKKGGHNLRRGLQFSGGMDPMMEMEARQELPIAPDEKDTLPPDGIAVALVNFPPTFQQFDEEGNDTGSLLISALKEILKSLSTTMNDISKIEMIYTNGHMEHIGLANHTYTYLTETMGMDPSNVPIIAPQGVKNHFEQATKRGVWAYRAPMPTVTAESFLEHRVGGSTMLKLTAFNENQLGDSNAVVFMEADGLENPAIMMVVDIVSTSFAPSTDLFQYVDAHDFLLEFPLGDNGYFVGGHFHQVGDRSDIALNQEVTSAILEAAAMALQTVNVGAVLGIGKAFAAAPPGSSNFGDSWARLGAYYDELSRVCTATVLARFGCDVDGLDETLYSSCNAAHNFLRSYV